MRIFHAFLVASAMAVACMPAHPAIAGDQAPVTRLYVKSEPQGAAVSVDGTKTGTTNDLFTISSGRHQVRLEIEGYAPAERTVDVAAGEITRLEVSMQVSEARAPTTAGTTGAAIDAIQAFLRRREETAASEALTSAMLATVRAQPAASPWSGRQGTTLFAVVARRISEPSTPAAHAATVNVAERLAIHELVITSSLEDVYQSAGLTDVPALRVAIARTTDELRLIGMVSGAQHSAADVDGYAIAWVTADEASVRANLASPPQLGKVRIAYRDELHQRARALMAKRDWAGAILIWRHLHQSRLVSQTLYLDAATCFEQLSQSSDALRVLAEALESFHSDTDSEFFEHVGDLALRVELPEAQPLATQSYELASSRLRETTTTAPPPTTMKTPTTAPTVQSR